MAASTRFRPRVDLIGASLVLLGLAVASGTERVDREDRFRQLDELLPTPNSYRTASGAPGHEYWQQQVDYVIDVRLDDEGQALEGSETITYHNNSPDTLRYLWLQLDGNLFAPDSHAVASSLAPGMESMSYGAVETMQSRQTFDGSEEILAVRDAAGRSLPHTINDTMMRIDLPEPLLPGRSQVFSVDWTQNLVNAKVIRARGGYEYFEEDDNYLYEVAQWFPRLCAYTDYAGWQNKQFLGRGEFTLEFGDYLVRIDAPADHIVGATGVLQNPADVLSGDQLARLDDASRSDRPLFVVTPEEAEANEESRDTARKTWTFQAENVRDFAWCSSRKFIWDAVLHEVEGNEVWCMSYYPNEGEPLWSRYSTHAVVHTLDIYSKFTIPYPYPTAISVNGPIGGMEYPMICFNGPRPEKDGTYSKRTKYGLVGVIIHEVGHNYFPMIINSDERQWTWMDEGLNTFVQFLTEQEWEDNYPSRRGNPENITNYMSSENVVPIMTNSESLLQFGNNAYAKPATALNILRETVMGRELFDFAFKEYSRRWAFRRPEPADLFRTMEDASAVDLDWFWRGWFYTTDNVDLAIRDVHLYRIDSRNPEVEKAFDMAKRDATPDSLSDMRNRDLPKRTHAFPELIDFYNTYDDLEVTSDDLDAYAKLIEKLEDKKKAALELDLNLYVVDLENQGGIPMPVILDVEFEDGTHQEIRVPAQFWQNNSTESSKLIPTEKRIARITLDPHLETADVDLSDNHFPPRIEEEHIRLTDRPKSKNPMQEAADREERARKAAEGDSGDGGDAADSGSGTGSGAEAGTEGQSRDPR